MDLLKKEITIENPIEFLMNVITVFYLVVILCVNPLYYTNKYYSIGDDKWYCWIIASTFYVAIMAVLYTVGAVKNILSKRSMDRYESEDANSDEVAMEAFAKKNSDTIMDYFMLGYLIICVVSTVFSPYKDIVWYGADDWNMGLWSQLMFILGYFFISRVSKINKSIFYSSIIVALAVFIIEILMRFGIDPLKLHVDLELEERLMFVSTIGQATWYSSYMVLFIPMTVIAYYFAENGIVRILSAIGMIISFASLVTQNSDCAYLAYGAMMMVLFWISFESNKRILRFLEVVIFTLTTWKIVGIIQILMGDRIDRLDSLSIWLSQSRFTWTLLAVVISVYLILRWINSNIASFEIMKFKYIRVIVALILSAGIVLTILYIILNTMGLLSESVSSSSMYLFFSDDWGNYRGYTWKSAVNSFVQENVLYKIIGNGPDTFGPNIYRFLDYGNEKTVNFFMSNLVSCSHNEWMNELITGGIIGLFFYFGLFVVSFVRCMKYACNDYRLYGFAMAEAAYVVHNFFCYQQVVCTSVIFAFFGISEWIIRDIVKEKETIGIEELTNAND